MAKCPDVNRLNREEIAYLKRDRYPEARMKRISHVITESRVCEPWPGDEERNVARA